MMRRPLAVLLALSLLLAGCADLQTRADDLASPAALTRETVSTDAFVLTTYRRLTRPGQPLHVYIEGDGLAWISRNQPSDDPTPLNPLALRLAAADAGPNVVYLSRPCQFTPMQANPRCTVAMWTGRRFAPEVLDSLDQAINYYVRQGSDRGVELIGYSGGGALAVLLAARRHDVLSVRSVAGNLDQAEVNRLHGVSQMPASLNAIDVAARVAKIPQWHFSGGEDTTVPPLIAARFAAAAGGTCVHLRIVPGLTHGGDWAAQWPQLLALPLGCGEGKEN